MPQDYILTARATTKHPSVQRTPREAYFRWHLPKEGYMSEEHGLITLPAIKHTDCNDFNKSQRKRFSEWGVVSKTFDKMLLEKKGIRVPARPTGIQVASQFDAALQLHLREVCDWHPRMKKRRRNRNGDVAKKVSTIATEIREIRKHKAKMNQDLEDLTTLRENVWKHTWLRNFVRTVKYVLMEQELEM